MRLLASRQLLAQRRQTVMRELVRKGCNKRHRLAQARGVIGDDDLIVADPESAERKPFVDRLKKNEFAYARLGSSRLLDQFARPVLHPGMPLDAVEHIFSAGVTCGFGGGEIRC